MSNCMRRCNLFILGGVWKRGYDKAWAANEANISFTAITMTVNGSFTKSKVWNWWPECKPLIVVVDYHYCLMTSQRQSSRYFNTHQVTIKPVKLPISSTRTVRVTTSYFFVLFFCTSLPQLSCPSAQKPHANLLLSRIYMVSPSRVWLTPNQSPL